MTSPSAALDVPVVLLAWDTPTSSLSAGWTRYVLERRFGQPVTAVRTNSLARANLADFDVVVLPSGGYGGAINEAVLNRLKDWLRAGGTLITLAEATRWATGSTVGLLDTQLLLKDGKPDTGATGATGAPSSWGEAGTASPGNASASGAKPPSTPVFDYDKAIQPDRERPAREAARSSPRLHAMPRRHRPLAQCRARQ